MDITIRTRTRAPLVIDAKRVNHLLHEYANTLFFPRAPQWAEDVAMIVREFVAGGKPLANRALSALAYQRKIDPPPYGWQSGTWHAGHLIIDVRHALENLGYVI